MLAKTVVKMSLLEAGIQESLLSFKLEMCYIRTIAPGKTLLS